MQRNPIFAVYGMLVMMATGWSSYTGWPSTSGGARTVSPKSIRDNPGAYRPIYLWYHRYSGGK